MSTSKKGRLFEELAVRYLESLGYRILCRNYHCRYSEIDIVAQDGSCLVFVEVKGSNTSCDPLEKVDKRKVQRLLACAEMFLQNHPADECRVDIIVVHKGRLSHIKGVELF
ncbi:YraN family protein [Thermocrinis minervae]|uniref:UPF0102 protein SAMN05444391_1363 n=1 Tax=Thermocrinis minervae TaxID=381751 RepID=A0A1M6T9X1_9AQUI|nr:YraN family protein [Thermocrinis minervae]SHK53751.1 putative endonuclease [Thermocrinis minervae]